MRVYGVSRWISIGVNIRFFDIERQEVFQPADVVNGVCPRLHFMAIETMDCNDAEIEQCKQPSLSGNFKDTDSISTFSPLLGSQVTNFSSEIMGFL